jgi:[ribosomal protein S18]-alanine N-acetyltransferase
MKIRWCVRSDVDEVTEIERLSFEFPYTKQEIVTLLKQPTVIGLVCEIDGEIAGYIIYDLATTSLIIHVIAVHPKYRRSGIGTALIERLKWKLTGRRVKLEVLVRESNLSALAFFKSNGLIASGLIRKPYPEQTCDDGVMMAFRESQPLDIRNRVSVYQE